MVSIKCKVCLSGNDRMCNIKNTLLERLFEIISKKKYTIDGQTEKLCYVCHNELQECKKLYDKLIRTEKIIEQVSSISGLELTKESITSFLDHEITKRFTVTSTTGNFLPLDKPDVTEKQEAHQHTTELAQLIAGTPSAKKLKTDDLQQEEEYPCKKCNKTFQRKKQLFGHMVSHKTQRLPL